MTVPDFRPGQQVRIRDTADSEFAGCRGTIVFVAESVCDVKIVYRRKGSRRRLVHIGTFRKEDLESLRKPMDLVAFSRELSAAPDGPGHRRLLFTLLLVLLAACLAWGVWTAR